GSRSNRAARGTRRTSPPGRRPGLLAGVRSCTTHSCGPPGGHQPPYLVDFVVVLRAGGQRAEDGQRVGEAVEARPVAAAGVRAGVAVDCAPTEPDARLRRTHPAASEISGPGISEVL